MADSTYTTNLSLEKQDIDQYQSLLVLNANLDKVDAALGRNHVKVSVSNLSALPYTYSNSKITAKHEVYGVMLSNSAAQPSDWSFSTADGSLTISGTISGTTNAVFYLAEFY